MTITPALTAEEWARAAEHAVAEDDGRYTMVSMAYMERRFQAGMALCNHALPDDDPRKITRADVELLQIARDAGRIESDFTYAGRPLRFGEQIALRRLAEKLSALLPPEVSA